MLKNFGSGRAVRTLAIAVGLAALAVSGSASAAKVAAPFSGLSGSWAGAGTIRFEDGQSERISCRAYYTPSRDGLGIALRCASTSYAIDLRSKLDHDDGRVSGSWEERTFSASGTLRGRATPGRLSVAISGGGLSGTMSVSFGGSNQSVSILTSGVPLKGVSINMSRR